MTKPRKRSLELPESPLAWPIPIAAGIAALWVVLVSVIATTFVMSIGWILTADSRTDFVASLQTGVALLMLVHAVPVESGDMAIGLPPLLLTLLLVVLLRRAMKWAVRSTIVVNKAGLLLLVFSMAMSYAILTVMLSLFLGDGVEVNASRLLLASFGWAALAGIWAIATSRGAIGPETARTFTQSSQRTERRVKARPPHDILVSIWESVAPALRSGVIAGARASALTLLCGFGFTFVMFIIRFSDFNAVITILTTQPMAQLAITLLFIAYIPSVAVWFSAMLLGPGFVVGGGSAVTVITQVVGPLPAVPFLALIPTELPWVARLLLILPALAAFVVTGKKVKEPDAFGFLFAAALTASCINGWLSTLASGPLGSGRFDTVGVSLWQVLVWSFIWTALGIAARIALQRRKQTAKAAE